MLFIFLLCIQLVLHKRSVLAVLRSVIVQKERATNIPEHVMAKEISVFQDGQVTLVKVRW